MALISHGQTSKNWHPSLFTFDEQELNHGELSEESKAVITELAYECFAKTGLHDWTFEFHDPEKYVMGLCYHETKTITLCPRNYTMLKHPYLVKKGLYHEISHALNPKPHRPNYKTWNDWVLATHDQDWKDRFSQFGFPTRYGWRNVAEEIAQAVCFTRPDLSQETIEREFYALKAQHNADASLVSVACLLKVLDLLSV